MRIPKGFPDTSVCILGLGYVGLTLATTMASLGFRVLGIEAKHDVVAMLKRGDPHFFEPGLADQLRHALRNETFRAETVIPTDSDASVFIITVGTPLGPDGRSRMDMIERVARDTAVAAPDGALVILRSTVRQGTSQGVVAPILQASGKRFDLAFCPERTLEGVALKELRHLPQIVGGATEQAAIRAVQLFQFVTPTTVRVRDLATAELIKLIDNSYRDVQFGFANEVARICDAIGISAVEVIGAGKLGYTRTNVPLPGPVGGPCLEKDPHILAEGLSALGHSPEIVMTARRLNERQPEESIRSLSSVTKHIAHFPDRPTVLMLGLAFKGRPETDDLRGTMARPILQALRRAYPDGDFRGFDHVVPPAAIQAFGLDPAESLESAVTGANVVIIANNHPRFADMPIEALSSRMASPAMIYDFWNNFDPRELKLASHVGYMALGAHGLAILPSGGS